MEHELENKSKYVLVMEHLKEKTPIQIEQGMMISSVDSQHKTWKTIRV